MENVFLYDANTDLLWCLGGFVDSYGVYSFDGTSFTNHTSLIYDAHYLLGSAMIDNYIYYTNYDNDILYKYNINDGDNQNVSTENICYFEPKTFILSSVSAN